MISKRRRNFIFVEAAILTFVIYFFAILANGYLDEQRIDEINYEMFNSSLSYDALVVSHNFYDSLNISDCEIQKRFIFDNFDNFKEVGKDLSNYGQLFLKSNENISKNKQREYFLDEIALYIAVEEYNEVCEDERVVPIVYFFNSLNTNLDKQSLILEQFALNNENKTIIFSFDINYEDEPLLIDIKNRYNITFSPFVIIGNKTTRDLANDNLVVSLNTVSLEYKKIRGEI